MDRLILITGAGGQVGKHALLEYADGAKASHVIATDITGEFPIPVSSPLVTYSVIKSDVRNKESLSQIKNIILGRPEKEILIQDIVGLFRYSADEKDLHEVNVLGQKNLIEEIVLPLERASRNVRLVFWGAAAVYGDFAHNELLPAKENYPLEPQNDYAKSKRDAEEWLLHYHKEHGIWVTVMRCGAIYGEGGIYGMSQAFILMLLGMLEPVIVGNGKNRVALVHARDTVRIADFLSRQNEANGKAFNVRDNTAYTLEKITKVQCEASGTRAFHHFRMPKDLFQEQIVAPLGKKVKEWKVEPTIDPGLAKMMSLDSYVDISALKELFEKKRENFESYLLHPDAEEGVTSVVQWYREHWKEWVGYYV